MLFLYWPNTILPYKMAAVEQETYGNKLAPHGVYSMTNFCSIADQSDALSQSPEMHELMTHVAQKRPVKWFQVGIQLQIDMPILEAYEAEYSNQMRLFAKVFEHWRREEKLPYTWNTIIIALERVDENRIATDIRQWLRFRK